MNSTLTSNQRAIIVGLILGDGHLETQNNGRTYRLKVEHGIKQAEYVDWLHDQLKDMCLASPRQRTRISLAKELSSYGFATQSLGTLRFYGQLFYQNNKKVIPTIISKLLTPLSVAIWFMDDGSFKSATHKTYIIHANGYSKDELEIIKDAFEKKFNIRIGIHKQYDQWRLYVYSDSAESFRKMIEPFMLPSMKYKLG